LAFHRSCSAIASSRSGLNPSRRTAVFLAEAFGSMDAIEHASLEELQLAEEVGPKVAEAVVQYFSEPGNRALVDRLRQAGLQFFYTSNRLKAGPLHCKTLVITGTLPTLSRDEAKRLIEQAGGFDEEQPFFEDYDLWLRACKHFRFYCLKEYLVFSLLKEDNFKKKYNEDLVSLLTKNIADEHRINEKERNDLLGRVEYYFGNTVEARKRLSNGNITRNIKLLIYSFLPGAVLNALRGKRLSLFMSTNLFNVSSYRNTLKRMLSV